MEGLFKGTAAVVGAIITYLFGGWSALLGILLVFVILDYISGVAASAKEGKLSSSVGLWGIGKKVSIFAIVAIAYLVDCALNTGTVTRDAAIWFYLANELISILENAGRLDVPLPPMLEKTIAVLKSKGDGGA